MEGIVNLPGQRSTDAFHQGQVFHARPGDFLQSSQLPEQLLTPLWPDTGYLLQWRDPSGPCTALPVAGNRKTVSLVPDLLDQVQGR